MKNGKDRKGKLTHLLESQRNSLFLLPPIVGLELELPKRGS